MYQKVIKNWPLILVLAAAFITRILRLENLFYFMLDESVPAFVARRLILWHHIQLLGGSMPFGFHLGPYFFWFYAMVLFIGRLNPLAWGWTAAFLSILTTFLMFTVGKSLGGRKVGITAAIFWAFSYLANIYDRHLWALFWGPLVSLLVLYFLNKIQEGRQKFIRRKALLIRRKALLIYPLALTIALAIHADLSNLVFVVLTIIFVIAYKISPKKNLLIIFTAILLLISPLVIFDLRHNFANIKPTQNFFKNGKNNPEFNLQKFPQNLLIFPQSASRLVYTFGDDQIPKQYTYCKNFAIEKLDAIPKIITLLSMLAIIYFVVWSFRSNRKPGWRQLSALIIIYFLAIQLYGTILKADIFEHYITGLFPAFLLIVAFFVSKLPKKLWLIALGIFVAANFYKLSLAKNSQGLTQKREAIEYVVREVGNKPFSLDSLSTCWKFNGYRYLFTVFGREPVKSYVDPMLAYLYGTTPVWDHHPATVVTFVVHDFAPETQAFYQRYALLKSHEVSSALFGSIEVIIMDNSSGWFDKSQ